jgi:hypothetical protein
MFSDAVMRWTDPASVVLDGTVYSFEAHAALLHAAWATPGVHHVHDAVVIRVELAA